MPVPGKIEYILRAKGPYLHFTRIVKQAGVFLFLVFERQGVHLSYKIKQGFRWSWLRRPLVILRSFSVKRPNSSKGKLSSIELEAALKGLCFTAVQFILFYFANYLPSIAMELKVGKEITWK